MNKIRLGIVLAAFTLASFICVTWCFIHDPSDELLKISLGVKKPQILDRNNIPLNITYENRWNLHQIVPLEKIPTFLQQAFITSEDKRFYEHGGVDWLARLHALWGNVIGRKTRGASTITEQVVQMIHPKKRSLWSKWLEGWEAVLLERKVSKSQILEFYLNQVPYSKRNRGVVQGADYYFDHDVSLLNKKSMLALALIVKSPNRFDLHKNASLLVKDFSILAQKLHQKKVISDLELEDILNQKLELHVRKNDRNHRHFTHYILDHIAKLDDVTILTTLDVGLENQALKILNRHLRNLKKYKVNNAGLIIVENATNEVLSWVVANNAESETQSYDSILTKRQPGSTLKPFLYAMDIDAGSSAATIIDDAKIEQSVGTGMHQFSNYSHTYYGKVTLRQALANSLNVPAIKTIDKVGVDNFLTLLHQLRFDSLDRPASIYGTGLSLGNGEVTLLELVRAFTVFPNKGVLRDLKFTKNDQKTSNKKIFKPTTSSIISHILSDKVARSLEFSTDIIFTSQTAFKTGTSTDFRDAWIVGYNANYLVGIWLGNLNNEPMDGVTGSIGALPILQDIISVLDKRTPPKDLYMDQSLVKKEICVENGIVRDAQNCNAYSEFFTPNAGGKRQFYSENFQKIEVPHITFPTQNLIIAIDPKVPRSEQNLRITLSDLQDGDSVNIYVDDILLPNQKDLWEIMPGKHVVHADIARGTTHYQTEPIVFNVIK